MHPEVGIGLSSYLLDALSLKRVRKFHELRPDEEKESVCQRDSESGAFRERTLKNNRCRGAIGEASRIEFIGDGSRVTAIRLTNPLGPASEFPRTR